MELIKANSDALAAPADLGDQLYEAVQDRDVTEYILGTYQADRITFARGSIDRSTASIDGLNNEPAIDKSKLCGHSGLQEFGLATSRYADQTENRRVLSRPKSLDSGIHSNNTACQNMKKGRQLHLNNFVDIPAMLSAEIPHNLFLDCISDSSPVGHLSLCL
eukprot:scaffold670801_cov57-Prasinocladus_malaysianus.AAC.1